VPELPEVEVLRRHLQPILLGKTIRGVEVRRERVLAGTPIPLFKRTLNQAKFQQVDRRGKYLLFEMQPTASAKPRFTLMGHLGMTGRMYLQPRNAPLPKHAAVVMDLGRERFVFEDVRYFGRLTLNLGTVSDLGPEPLSEAFTAKSFAEALKRSRQPIKVRLLDQTVVAGVGNIYASEALFRAGISPLKQANRVSPGEVLRLRTTLRKVLTEAIKWGSTVPLSYRAEPGNDGLFYFGSASNGESYYDERLRVYDRAGKPCHCCGSAIVRCVQAARSTFYCQHCQRTTKRKAKSV
jgi:formamidopyrimidine-DNA glycosylase